MTWKQFVRRFKEMMADTSTTPLGVTDLEAWHRKQKEITERCLCEEQEKREQAKNWLTKSGKCGYNNRVQSKKCDEEKSTVVRTLQRVAGW